MNRDQADELRLAGSANGGIRASERSDRVPNSSRSPAVKRGVGTTTIALNLAVRWRCKVSGRSWSMPTWTGAPWPGCAD